MRALPITHLLTVSWAIVTGIALLWPFPPSESFSWWSDWIPMAAHLVLFLGMVIFLDRSLRAARKPRPMLTALLLAFAYGMVLEVAQISVEGRGAEWQDVGMNGLGGLIGVALAGLFERRRLTRSHGLR